MFINDYNIASNGNLIILRKQIDMKLNLDYVIQIQSGIY